ncbi:Cna protein B-type domain protein [Leptospira ilyithenensis]|uniref:Cna protein B-type domain protein n=1 Tax=Leptospira ilyithenensis TaxID=2484901 RepID=A0A4R9LU55_9LEPT|nr:Cna protein B-type domain protein [Leptospira ilyithenensis]TGN14333.1 Cna protein B-type domain protein [Leptospira ilyithenensis]
MNQRGIFLLVLTLSFLPVGCSKKSKSMPFWFLLGSGGAGNAADSASGATPADSNGVSLPASSDSTVPSSSGGVPENQAQQEVPTSGPAKITGVIRPVVSGSTATDVCGQPGAPSAPNCLDLTLISIRIEVANGNSYSLVASSNAEADGSFVIDVDNLPNNNYRVLINTGNGLNYSYQDFSFVFDPTQNGFTLVDVGDLKAERLYYTSGQAQITGSISTPGFSGDGVTVPSGPLVDITVVLRDGENNLVGTTTTAGDGTFSFSIPNLPNGNYTIEYQGSSVTSNGQPFANNSETIHFTFQGTNPSVTTVVALGETTLPWMAATDSSLTLNGSVIGSAVSGDSVTAFTIKIKNEQGAVVDSTNRSGNGSFQLTASGLPNGVYYIEVSANNFFTVSQSFLFTAAPDGGMKNITLPSPIGIIARPSNVVGYVRDGNSNHIPGSAINFKPDRTQAPSNLVYLTGDPLIGNAAKLWIVESLSAVAAVNCAINPSGSPSICSCAIAPTISCLVAVQGAGPWNYSTWGNKVYEVRPSDNQVYFSAVAGKWAYYISAPGFENWCGGNSSPCSSNPQTITLNGNDHNAGNVSMTSITNRSQISGTIVVRDTAPTNPSLYSNQTGLFAVLLGNTTASGQPLAHIAVTSGGSFAFNGFSYVVTLPAGLASDTDRVGYALQTLKTGGASTLAGADSIAVDNDQNASIDVIAANQYYFRQSSYQLVIVDTVVSSPRASYLAATSLSVDNSNVATNQYASTPVTFTVNGTAVHNVRATLSGTVTDAISTGVVSGATLTLGRFDSGNFVADVRRDCSGGFVNDSCTVAAVRTAGQDQVIGSVTSQSNGSYAFSFVPQGTYTIRVEKNGIVTYFPVEVGSGGGTVSVNTPVITSDGKGHLSGSVRTPGGFAFSGTYSLEIVDPNAGIIRPTTGVQPASIATGATTFSNANQYTIFNINAGRWKVRFVASGYKTVEGIVDIQADATTNFDIITFVPGTQTPGAISGRALSALYNTGVCDLTARIRPGVNVKSGSYAIDANGTTIPSVKTATDGSYAIPNVPPGNYTLEATGSGKRGNCTSSVEAYSTTFRTVIAAGTETPSNQNILVSPVLGDSEMRVVLSWGAKPKDLDSHLQYSATNSGSRIVWNRKAPLGAGNGELDYDITTGYGPETISLKGAIWSQDVRYYSIYNWSGEANMGVSGATIRVFKGSIGEVRNYAISPNHSNRWWKIFCIGADKNITDVGTSNCNASGFLERSMY